MSRSRQTSKSLRVRASMPLRRIDHHDGRIDRGERAVGVLREVLMARRVEEIEDAAAIFEGHHGGDDGDAALALDPHPVGAGLAPVALRLDLTASWIAPPNSRSFSVSVVLPASGWEMMAKVRRRLTEAAMSSVTEGARLMPRGDEIGVWPFNIKGRRNRPSWRRRSPGSTPQAISSGVRNPIRANAAEVAEVPGIAKAEAASIGSPAHSKRGGASIERHENGVRDGHPRQS